MKKNNLVKINMISAFIAIFSSMQSQNIGVGTTSPLSKLHIKGQLRVDTLLSGSISDSILTIDANGVFKKRNASVYTNIFNTDGSLTGNRNVFMGAMTLAFDTTTLFINPSTNRVGIGTINPGEALDVRGNARIGNNDTSNYISFRGVLYDGAGNFDHTFIGERRYSTPESSELLLFKGNDFQDRIRLLAAEHRFDTYGVGSTASGSFETVANSSNNSNRMIIKNNGNVGIGTSDPNDRLEVDGNVRVGLLGAYSASASANYGRALLFGGAQGMFPTADGENSDPLWIARYNAGNNFSEMRVNIGDDNQPEDKFVIGSSVGTPTGFTGTTPWTPYFTFDMRGFLGIGTSSAKTKLDLSGVKSTGTGLGTGSGNDNPSQAIIPAGTDGATRYNDWPSGWGGGISTYDIIGATTFFSVYLTRSDRKLKENILDMNREVVDQVLKLRPVTYIMKERTPETEGLHYGFIAQEVRELFPSIVTKADDEEKGTIGMNYQALIAPLVKVVQSQYSEIELLKNDKVIQQQKYEELLKRLELLELKIK